MECQGSGHTSGYGYSLNYVKENYYIKQIDIQGGIVSLQETATLGTAYIIRGVLGI